MAMITTITMMASSCIAAAKSLQSCPTLCDPIDGSPPGSPVPGILQARTLEWVAISFSNAWKWKAKGKSLSRVWLFETPWTTAYQAPPSTGFSRQEYWSGVPLPSPHHTLLKVKYDPELRGLKNKFIHIFPHANLVWFPLPEAPRLLSHLACETLSTKSVPIGRAQWTVTTMKKVKMVLSSFAITPLLPRTQSHPFPSSLGNGLLTVLASHL